MKNPLKEMTKYITEHTEYMFKNHKVSDSRFKLKFKETLTDYLTETYNKHYKNKKIDFGI